MSPSRVTRTSRTKSSRRGDVALLALVAWACSFPDYSLSGSLAGGGAPSSGGTVGEAGHAEAIADPRPLTFFWIGASSADTSNTWHWADGDAFWRGGANGSAVGASYFNWRISSPQNTTSAACVFSDDNGWEDGDCTINRGYVCEAD